MYVSTYTYVHGAATCPGPGMTRIARGRRAAQGNSISNIGSHLGDRRISYDEFVAAVPLLESWGSSGEQIFTVPDPAVEFHTIDADHSGAIRFDEFSRWALLKRLSLSEVGKEASDEAANPSHRMLASATAEAAERRRDFEEHSAYLLRQREARLKPVISLKPSIAVPELPSTVRRRLLPEGGRGLPDEQRKMARRFLERYTHEYKAR